MQRLQDGVDVQTPVGGALHHLYLYAAGVEFAAARRLGLPGGQHDGARRVLVAGQPRVGGQCEPAVEHHAPRRCRRPGASFDIAHGQPRIVVQRGAAPHEDGIVLGAHPVHDAARGGVGDPPRVAAARGDAPVERLGDLQVNVGPSVVRGGEERHVQQQRRLRLHADGYRNARLVQQPYAGAADVRVGIEGGDGHAGDAGADDGRGAGRRQLAGVGGGTRLQVAVQVCAARILVVLAAGVERGGLGMAGAVALVEPLANYAAVIHYHTPGHRVGRSASPPALGELQRTLHVVVIARSRHVHHASRTPAPAERAGAPPPRGAASAHHATGWPDAAGRHPGAPSAPVRTRNVGRNFSHPDCYRRHRNCTGSVPPAGGERK